MITITTNIFKVKSEDPRKHLPVLKSTIETLEKVRNMFKINRKDLFIDNFEHNSKK